MSDKFPPPHFGEDFTEDDFDKLLESKFDSDSGFDRKSILTKKDALYEKTLTPIEVEIDSGTDPYDYTIPETREAWVRLKGRVNELEDVNLELKNQLELRDELEGSELLGDDTVDSLAEENEALTLQLQQLKEKLIPTLERENTLLKSRLAEIEENADSLKQDKTLLNNRYEKEQQILVKDNQQLKKELDEAEKSKHSLKMELQKLSQEMQSIRQSAQDAHQEMKFKEAQLSEELAESRQEVNDLTARIAAQIKEKSTLLEKAHQEHEQESRSSILALEKEKKAIMDELKEQLSSLQKYVMDLEKEKDDWGNLRDQLTMKVGLLEDEKKSLNDQKSRLDDQAKEQKHQLNEIKTNQTKKHDELKGLIRKMASLLDQS